MRDYVPPSFLADGFNCPHCNVWTQQEWFHMTHAHYGNMSVGMGVVKSFVIARCQKANCKKVSIWITNDGHTGKMVYPGETTAPLPIEHMPDNVSQIYEEARQIFEKSPRAAAGLLRLAIQVLMPHLGEKESNLNTAIGNLVKKGCLKLFSKL